LKHVSGRKIRCADRFRSMIFSTSWLASAAADSVPRREGSKRISPSNLVRAIRPCADVANQIEVGDARVPLRNITHKQNVGGLDEHLMR